MIWLGVVLLRVKTPEGTIVIEADQLEIAGAVVEVDGQQRVKIDPGKGQERVTVVADEKEHVLKVTKGGFETLHRDFTLKAGEEQTLTVRLEPLPVGSGSHGAAVVATAGHSTAGKPKVPTSTPPPAAVVTAAHLLRHNQRKPLPRWLAAPFGRQGRRSAALGGLISAPPDCPASNAGMCFLWAHALV